MSEQEQRSMSNPEVGDLIDKHFTYVSRLRSGVRQPSIPTMAKIKEVFGWSYEAQVNAILADEYHIVLERYIDAYAKTHPKEQSHV